MKKVCVWSFEEFMDAHETGCGQTFTLNDGSLKENGFKFCYHCGKEIREKKPRKGRKK